MPYLTLYVKQSMLYGCVFMYIHMHVDDLQWVEPQAATRKY
jgi:hypothetical protein